MTAATLAGSTVDGQLDRGPATVRAGQAEGDHPADDGRTRMREREQGDRGHRPRCVRIVKAAVAIRFSGQGATRWGVPVPGRPHALHRPVVSGTWSRRIAAIRSGISANTAVKGSVGSRTGLVPLGRVGIKGRRGCASTYVGPTGQKRRKR
jgi:excisionase family DNA binding protein